ncbi:hypothetical protein PR048_022656 [Dryococelus australis]|uniref:Uncharacterized protein n=1 Tax=Dryococelus australis TaxID=614101 RepID=A0ABQ9H1K8_9NEOP|nr:hypothetical protein PR048_022656 [Dryococelus australis]
MPPYEYKKCTSEGFFAVRRKNEFWGGVWIDLTIEQDLMCALKTKGELTRLCGITESTLAYFVAAFLVCLKLHNVLEELSGIKTGSSDQHVELKYSCRTRDARDVAVLLSWLKEYSPWDVDCLPSLALSEIIVLTVIKQNMLKNRVKNLSAVARSILIRDDGVELNSQQLFIRIVCVMKTENVLEHYYSYELSPRPPALFDEMAMHKTVKSYFLQLFSYTTPEENSTNHARIIVIDGRHLLHALVWLRPATYGQIADTYLEFVQNHYRSSVTVVFDGYNVQYTKSQEHFRHASKMSSAEIMFDMNTSASTTHADFLSNLHNKERLITLLSHHFETAGIEECSSEGDADTLEIQENIGESKDSVLFYHVVTGCDTSAFSGKDKKKAWKILQRPDMRNVTKVFKSPESTKEEVCAAAENFVIALYGGINDNSLDELRVIQYTRFIAKQPVTAAFELATLPLTSAACAEHSLRTSYEAPGHQHLCLCYAWFPVAVRQTVATDVNACMLDWPARQFVDIVEEEVA